jgi:hypothetical protein
LVGVDHSKAIMREETFGPAAAIIKVDRTRKQRVCAQDWNTGPSVKALEAGATHDEPSVCYGDSPLKHY